jgi:predicted N-acyltransferase
VTGCLTGEALAELAGKLPARFALGRATSLLDLPPYDLERLARGRGVFASAPYLLFMERMRQEQGVRYVTCTDTTSGTLVAVCPVYEGGASAGSYWSPNTHYLRRASGRGDDDAWTPTLFLGARSGYGWSFLVDPGLGQAGPLVLASMVRAAARVEGAETGGSAVAMMFLGESGRTQLCDLGAKDADFLLAGATSTLDLGWSCFEDYLADLARPDNARREIRAFDRSGGTTRVVPLSEGMAAVAPLFTQLEDKYGGSSTAEAELTEMERLGDAMGPAAQLILGLRGSRVIGAALFLEWEGTIYVRQAGFDYAVTGRAFEYFNLVYYGLVRHALTTGAGRIDYGMATYRAKLARGAVVEPLWGLAVDRRNQVLARHPEVQTWDRVRRHAAAVGTASALERVELP